MPSFFYVSTLVSIIKFTSKGIKFVIYFHFSGKDNMVPSRDEAQRLKKSLQNCTVRHFKDNGHTLLLVSSMIACRMFFSQC